MSVQIVKSKDKTVTRRNSDKLGFLLEGTGDDDLDKAIEVAGYSYDSKQDIFYSTMDPWQRNIGYCRLFDEAAAPMGMIIDCEPIYFNYNEKKWMIGFWKGQYDLVTGGEIGVYSDGLELNDFGFLSGTFYSCVSNNDLLQMSYTLKKNGKTLFTREGKHWWLTGFKLGEFSEPSELSMDVAISLKDVTMRDAFVAGLKNVGYSDTELTIYKNTVSFTFGTPHSPQPLTRIPGTDRIIQDKNELLCNMYQDITKSADNFPDKVKAIKEQAPEMYEMIIKIGKSKRLYEMFERLLMIIILVGAALTNKPLPQG